MGRYAGWIAAHAGISGGGDVILIPEIPFRYEAICAKILEREREGKHFTLVVVAEGAREQGKDYVTAGAMEKNREARLGGVGAVVAAEIQNRTGKETRVCVLGHLQRGGAPTSFDRLLCTRFGACAVQLIAEEKYGYMVALKPPDTVAVKISDAIGRLRTVPPNGDIVQTARAWGSISAIRRGYFPARQGGKQSQEDLRQEDILGKEGVARALHRRARNAGIASGLCSFRLSSVRHSHRRLPPHSNLSRPKT